MLMILVVDDEPKIVRLARDYLEKNGFRVVSAGDGPSALAMARREHPDLIVLDLLLPGMDGREVCRILRNERTCPSSYSPRSPKRATRSSGWRLVRTITL